MTVRSRSQPRWPLVGLSLLIAICTLQNIRVVELDAVPPAADESGYYRTCLAWQNVLTSDSPWLHARSLLFLRDLRPPLVPLLTGTVLALTGQTSIQIVRHSLLPFLWVAIIATFALGARMGGRRATGLLAAMLLAACPQLAGFSRLYWMDLPLLAVTAVALWTLLCTEDLTHVRGCVALGVMLGLGLLTQHTFPIFVAGPLGWVAVRSWRVSPSRTVRHLAVVTLCALAVAGLWFGPTLRAAWLNYAYSRGVGPLDPRPWWTLSNLATYARYLITEQAGGVTFAALLVSLPLFWRERMATRALLVLWIGVPYLFFTYGVLGIAWSRFTLPCLPAIALVTALGLMRLSSIPAARAALWLLALLSIGAVLIRPCLPGATSPTPFVWDRMLASGLTTPQTSDFYLQVHHLAPGEARRAAVFPDHGSIASVLGAFAAEQGLPLLFMVPSARVGAVQTPATIDAYPLVVHVLAPQHDPSLHVLQQLDELNRQWRKAYPRFAPITERRLPNGYRLLFYRRIVSVNGDPSPAPGA
jgi:4-amino-4-deoxy-L-arabinose transferase-like glycosyltransferase